MEIKKFIVEIAVPSLCDEICVESFEDFLRGERDSLGGDLRYCAVEVTEHQEPKAKNKASK